MTDNKIWEKFPDETVELLFTAVEEDDIVDENISLPSVIDLHCPYKKIH